MAERNELKTTEGPGRGGKRERRTIETVDDCSLAEGLLILGLKGREEASQHELGLGRSGVAPERVASKEKKKKSKLTVELQIL